MSFLMSKQLVFTGAVVAACMGASAQSPSSDVATEMREAQLEWSRSQRPALDRKMPLPSAAGRQSDANAKEDAKANVAQLWAISLQDKTLYRVMRRWAAQAQYQLVWQVDRDFSIESEVVFEGGFRNAVGQVMSGVAMTDFPLQAIFNTDTRVLRVVRYMEERDARR